MGTVVLDPVAVGKQQLKVVDMVMATSVLGDDVVNLQLAKLGGGPAPIATAFLLAEAAQ